MVDIVPFFLSTVMVSFPFAAVLPSLFCATVYWMTGLRPEWDAFLYFLLTMTYAWPK